MPSTSSNIFDKGGDSKTTQSAHLRWLATGFFLPIVGGIAMYMISHDQISTDSINSYALTSLTEQIPSAKRIEEFAQPVIKPLGDVMDFIVRRNDTLEQIFRQTRISLDDLATIRNLPGVQENLDSLKPGEHIAVTHIDGAIQKLVRRISETAMLSVTRDATGFAAQVVTTPLDTRTATAHGVIESSLFVSGRAAGMSSDLIMRLANDIFGWDIDFALEIQPNDQFTVVYEKKYRDGAYLSDGRILAAEFVNAGRTYRAVRYESADGEIVDYFTPDGKSMRKQFLRAPVDFKYISSNFSLRRFHPVLNITRAHQGVDYAAPTGTPIKAAGDGRASFVGVKGGYGKAIILEHGGSVSTLYGHMSRFASNLRDGSRVKQGEVIGYVGSTGTATGSHLHYEYRVNGVHRNPRTVSLPDAKPIPPSYLAAFEATSGTFLTQLDRAKAAQIAAIPAR